MWGQKILNITIHFFACKESVVTEFEYRFIFGTVRNLFQFF